MSRNSKKQEIADKVKEIKQRQQNWMKQRAESETIGNQQPDVKSEGRHVSKPKPVSQVQQPSKTSEHRQPSAQQFIASKKSKAKFQNWLKAKQNTGSDEEVSNSHDVYPNNFQKNGYHQEKQGNSDYANNHRAGAHAQDQHYSDYASGEYNSNKYKDSAYRDHPGSNDVNILRVPSTRPAGYATPDTDWNSDDDSRETNSDFEAKANDIIARVKGEARANDRGYNASTNHRVNKTKGLDLPSHSKRSTNEKGLKFSSHVCPSCEQLMIAPDFSPMLVIPCGHTLCIRCCSRSTSCSMCGAPIQSSTANVMLQQIITDHNTTTVKHVQQSYTGQRTSFKDNYRQEHQNLLTRQEILHEECNNINKNIRNLSKKLKQEQQQVDNIQREEKTIESKIKHLQEQLQALVGHRHEYEESCHKIVDQSKQETSRLVLVKSSIQSIQDQVEKIKMLSNSEL